MKKPKSKLHLVNLKVSKAEHKKLVENAKRYQNGNLSAWLRAAGRKYKPAA